MQVFKYIVLKEKITTKLPVMKKVIGSENELCIFCSSFFICMCLLEEENVEHQPCIARFVKCHADGLEGVFLIYFRMEYTLHNSRFSSSIRNWFLRNPWQTKSLFFTRQPAIFAYTQRTVNPCERREIKWSITSVDNEMTRNAPF